ncbi:MAG: type IV secretory system conjugative DNA transfer family protein [Acidimicrobiales bacterium]|jgi:type IV secretory pathway TraG/TraD family ATPase VirD4
MSGRGQTPFEGPFMVFLCGLAIVIAEGVAVDLSGQVASLVFGGHRLVPGGVGAGAGIFLRVWGHLADPRLAWSPTARVLLPGPPYMWVTLVGTQLLLLGLAVVAFRLVRIVRGATGDRGGSPMKANRSHVERRMGRSAVNRHTAALYGKDAVAGREPLALGVDVATGAALFAKSEDYILAVGVPRVGKGEGFVIPAVLRHKGSAVVTATRHDTYMDTAGARERIGPVYVFDPQGLVPYAEKLRWNPVKGCEVPQKAILRARGFAGFAGVGAGVDGGGAYWEQVAASIIRSYLHAAALEGLGVEQLLDWSRRPAARQPVRILSRHADAARGWNEDLAASTEVEPRHRDSIWATVRRAFDCFADPMVLEATRVDHDTFDPTAFLDGHGTIYLMGSPGAQHSVAPIVAALIEDIVDVARHQAAASATRRLESGLVLMLDECANIAPLGDLPKLVAELGGLGITTAVILQSVASARSIWGEAGERALRDLANITLVWGGQKDVAFLEEISRLAGEHDELVETVTHNDNGKSSSWTPRRTAVLPVWDIANLAPYHAVIVSPHLRPRVTHLPSWRKEQMLTALVEQSHGTSFGATTGG